MRFRILALLSILLTVSALEMGCGKGKGGKKKANAADPKPSTSPVVDANKQIVTPERAAELTKNLEETSAILKKLAHSTDTPENKQ
jgi:hypothetical protein